MPTCKCGKEVADWRGARGHVQFTEGDGHGDEKEVPDNWRDLFDEDDGDDEPDDVREAVDDDPEATQEAKEEVAEAVESAAEENDDSGESDASQKGRLRKALTEDVRHLWGGA